MTTQINTLQYNEPLQLKAKYLNGTAANHVQRQLYYYNARGWLTRIVTLSLIVLTSCCGLHTEVTYKYNNTVIYRVDECGKTTFYYNEIDKNSVRIWVEYSGINDGFSGYLKFEDNGKVQLLSGDGYFQTANADTSRFEYRRILAYQRPVLGERVYLIMLSTKYEKEYNQSTNTKVNVIYNIDKNEWF